LLNYTCECLIGSYSGRHCEKSSNEIVVHQAVSKLIGYIAILVIISAAMFIVIMDVLKYFFGIDSVGKELEQINEKNKLKQKKKPPVIIRYIYVNALAIQSSEKAISTISETRV
jgi:hypothetical protein